MLTEILHSINWVDILMLAVMVRIVFVGMKTGFVVELFKLLGAFLAIFVTHHYYVSLGQIFDKHLHLKGTMGDFAAYGVLWLVVFFIFKLIRDGIMLVLKVGPPQKLDEWVGLMLGLGRGVLVCSLTLAWLYVSGVDYLVRTANRSMSGALVSGISINIYKGFYDNLVSKFGNEQINEKVFDLKKSIPDEEEE